MNIFIDSGSGAASTLEASRIREEVFQREWKVTLPPLAGDDPERQLTLIARKTADNQPVAALTVVETTADEALHSHVGLQFSKGVRVARYTQLAVLKPYRGMNLPIRLILEARRRFIIPKRIGYTWLLYPAAHADSSSLCRLLGFFASSNSLLTEYGHSRVLSRDEVASEAQLRDEMANSFIVCGKRNEVTPVVTEPMDGDRRGLLHMRSNIGHQGLTL